MQVKRWILTVLAVVLLTGLCAQCAEAEVTTGTITIVVFGKDSDFGFWKIDGEYYVNLVDLMSAMPSFFEISDEGKLVPDEAAMLAAYNVLLGRASAIAQTWTLLTSKACTAACPRVRRSTQTLRCASGVWYGTACTFGKG